MDDSVENVSDGLQCDRQLETQSEVVPMSDTFVYPTSAFPSTRDVQETSNLETPATNTSLTPEITNADVPSIPFFPTITEKFADEFWTSATTTETIAPPSTTPHAESPTDPFEFVPSPGCSEGDSSKSIGDLIEHHEETHTTHSNIEGQVDARAPDVKHINSYEALPLVPSVIDLDPSSTSDPTPTPESVSLAAQLAPTQEEVEEAWPAPSNDNVNVEDAWGLGTIITPDTNPGDAWGSNNEAIAADSLGIEVKGDNTNNDWGGGGGWKSDKGKGDDRGHGKGGFRRDRPFWQPPERDGGWEGFRKRGGFKGSRRDNPDSSGGRNDNNRNGYKTNITDSTSTEHAWFGGTCSTKNDTTWDTPPKDVEAAWSSAVEPKLENPIPEERRRAPPQTENAWDAPPPPRTGRNPYRPVGTPKGNDGLLTPATTDGYSALWTAEGDASWGTGARTKKVLDSNQTEGTIRRVLGERARKDTPRPSIQGTQPPHVEEPPDEADTGDEEGDITPPPTTPTSPMHTRRSAPYSYVSSRSRRANSPTLTATTLDTGYISAGTATTTGRGLTKIATSGIPPARRARSRASSVVHKTGGRIVYEGGMEGDEDDYEYIYQETRPPLARGREVVLRDFVPTKQRAAHQQAPPQYVFVYEGEEEYEDGELYYTPAPPQDSHALVRRPAQPKAMSFRVPNTNTDVTITVQEAAPPPVRYTLARPRPAERVVYVPEPTRRARTAVPRIHEVGDDGYTIAGDDEYEDIPVIVKPVPKRRVYIRE